LLCRLAAARGGEFSFYFFLFLFIFSGVDPITICCCACTEVSMCWKVSGQLLFWTPAQLASRDTVNNRSESSILMYMCHTYASVK
jgi:hypothetical protein